MGGDVMELSTSPGRSSTATATRTSAPLRAVAGLVLVAALLSGCGGEEGPTASTSERSVARSDQGAAPGERPSTPPTSAAEGQVEPGTVARPIGPVAVHADPSDPVPELTLDATTSFGSPRTLSVVSQADDWLEVLLPVRPNGRTGFIRSEGAELHTVRHAVVVDLAARTLTLRADGETVLSTPVAIGSPDAPTPTGRFFVVDKLETGDGSSAYGPFALGLSGHSDVLTEFAGGDGQIGIHGTSDPSSIGQAVSHGCIRVPNEVVTHLADVLALGTPVTVL